jgi:exodeoxyribonuclease VII large subunit
MYWANDEKLAFKIANFPLPVMSAVGHTVDLSILDIVAKYSAKTPSE